MLTIVGHNNTLTLPWSDRLRIDASSPNRRPISVGDGPERTISTGGTMGLDGLRRTVSGGARTISTTSTSVSKWQAQEDIRWEILKGGLRTEKRAKSLRITDRIAQ